MSIDLIITIVKVIIPISLFFVWVVRYENIVLEFKNDFQYPSWLRDLTGILKLSCATMMLSSSIELQEIGLFGITALMSFAVLTHLRIGSTPRKMLPSITLLLLSLMVLYLG